MRFSEKYERSAPSTWPVNRFIARVKRLFGHRPPKPHPLFDEDPEVAQQWLDDIGGGWWP